MKIDINIMSSTKREIKQSVRLTLAKHTSLNSNKLELISKLVSDTFQRGKDRGCDGQFRIGELSQSGYIVKANTESGEFSVYSKLE